jgi:hypothetical protein
VHVGKVLLAVIVLWIPISLATGPDPLRDSFYTIGLQSDKSVEGFASLTTEEAFVKALMAARVPGGIVPQGGLQEQAAQAQIISFRFGVTTDD